MSDLSVLASIKTPTATELTTAAARTLEMLKEWTIDSQEAYGLAADELKALKAQQKALDERRTSITGPLNAALKSVNDLFRGPAALLGEAESVIKGKMIAWTEAQEAIQKAAMEAAAQAAAQQDDIEAAVSAAASVPVITTTAKVAGISKVQTKAKVNVTDKLALLKHIVEHPELLDIVEISETKLSQLAKALGSGFSVPGTIVTQEKSISARAN